MEAKARAIIRLRALIKKSVLQYVRLREPARQRDADALSDGATADADPREPLLPFLMCKMKLDGIARGSAPAFLPHDLSGGSAWMINDDMLIGQNELSRRRDIKR